VVISHDTGTLEQSVNEVPPARSGDNWLSCGTSFAGRLTGFVPGALWAEQPPDCVLLYDNSSVHNPAAEEILAMSGALLLHLPPCGGNPLSKVTRPPGMSRKRVVNSHATPL